MDGGGLLFSAVGNASATQAVRLSREMRAVSSGVRFSRISAISSNRMARSSSKRRRFGVSRLQLVAAGNAEASLFSTRSS